MAEQIRYFVVAIPADNKPDRVILVRDTSISCEDTITRARICLAQASQPSRENFEFAEKIDRIISDLGASLTLTVQTEDPRLASAGLETIKELLGRRHVRQALALEIASLTRASALADSLLPSLDSFFRNLPKVKVFLRALLHLNHAYAAFLLYRELNIPYENTHDGLAPTLFGDSVSLTELVGQEDFLSVMSNAPYHAVREALAMNKFQPASDSPWPTAPIERGTARGQAQLFPIEAELQPYMDPEHQKNLIDRMWEQRAELSDLDADVLDMMSAIWLEQARNTDSTARARIDDLLRLRGLKPKTGEGGRPSGFRKEQRERLFRSLHHLNNLWVRMWEMDSLTPESDRRTRRTKIQNIASRAFIITDIAGNQRGSDAPLEIEEFLFRPGMVFANFLFGVGRQTALLSRKAVQYDPYRQNWEKRLARYLSWQWRIEASVVQSPIRTFRAQTLLDAVGEKWTQEENKTLKDRLEKALHRLAADCIIARWSWIQPTNPHAVRRFLNEFWHQGNIEIEQPEFIRSHYSNLLPTPDSEHAAQKQIPLLSAAPGPIHERLLTARKNSAQTQGQLAAVLGITQAYYSQVESGKRVPSQELLRRIEDWIESLA
ncbi:helix-turn-helix domain-containing protein [Bryobacter aggregatus]|uniref:helix-turn-helix domain-containing protein n=1 Tax=Bryobacter aggregatus TaxID=360054 RepID=UPI00068EE403|nr:helix-turn-helix transcriptional regulator [Bryobacter aggregatus]